MQGVLTDVLGEMKDTAAKLQEARDFIRQAYLDQTDPRPWALSSSYGKDSEVTMTLVIEVIMSLPPEQCTRHVHIVTSDTRVETPLNKKHIADEMRKVNELCEMHGLPISTHLVQPPIHRSYYVTLIGKGNPMPSATDRKCTHQLKIEPMEALLKTIDYGAKVVGTRESESKRRKADLSKVEGFVTTDRVTGKTMLLPIKNFDADDVWNRLKGQLAWGSANSVRALYSKSGTECAYLNPLATDEDGGLSGGCNGRQGCHVCPVVVKDKSTEMMALFHPWLTPYTESRVLQMKVYGRYVTERAAGMTDEEWKHEQLRWELINRKVRIVTKTGYRRDGTRKQSDGRPLRNRDGCLSLDARKYLLRKLLEAQEMVWELVDEDDEFYPDPMISQEELDLIYQIHEEDERERPWLVKGIDDIEAAMEQARLEAEHLLERIVRRRQRETERRARLAEIAATRFEDGLFAFDFAG